MKQKPPVVTIMGHVDHGKTTLLDALRNSKIVDTEFGGITQHIGAFSVSLATSQKDLKKHVTFLDTPGHLAFRKMRSRGAQCTDIVVLVVAADDGVMPQTVESIRFANEYNVPIIVALNKIDKYNKKKVDELNEGFFRCGLILETMGGNVQTVEISALKRLNLDTLIECILLQAEVMDLRCDPAAGVKGVIIESNMVKGKGKVATLLIQTGTLKKGEYLLSQNTFCRVKSITNEHGKELNLLGPGFAAEVSGWKEMPLSGEVVEQVHSQAEAKKKLLVVHNEQQRVRGLSVTQAHMDKLSTSKLDKVRVLKVNGRRPRKYFCPTKIIVERDGVTADESQPVLNICLKSDTVGTLEAITNILSTYHDDGCILDVIHADVGDPTENDLDYCKTFNASLILFNTSISKSIEDITISDNITVFKSNVIYHLINYVKDSLHHRMHNLVKDRKLGEAVIQKIFFINEKNRKIIIMGSRCTSGIINKKSKFRVRRQLVPGDDNYIDNSSDLDEVVDKNVITLLYDLNCQELRHKKSQVETINQYVECGIKFEAPSSNLTLIKENDIIEAYEYYEERPSIVWDIFLE